LGEFGPHFTHGEKERLRSLTANTAGYHGARAVLHHLSPAHHMPLLHLLSLVWLPLLKELLTNILATTFPWATFGGMV